MSIPQLYPVYRLESFLQSIASADIAWMLRIRRQFLGVDDLGMLVDYVVFDMDTLADGCGREDDAVFDDAALFDEAHPRPMIEFSMVPSMRHPLETTEFFTFASSKYWVGQESLVLV